MGPHWRLQIRWLEPEPLLLLYHMTFHVTTLPTDRAIALGLRVRRIVDLSYNSRQSTQSSDTRSAISSFHVAIRSLSGSRDVVPPAPHRHCVTEHEPTADRDCISNAHGHGYRYGSGGVDASATNPDAHRDDTSDTDSTANAYAVPPDHCPRAAPSDRHLCSERVPGDRTGELEHQPP